MERMNGIDPMFIYSETSVAPMEVAYACILDPASAPAGYSFETVRQLLQERLPTLVPFRRRLMAVPLGLDHPRWVDDPDFDLDNHLFRRALPDPGGEAEFSEMVAGIMGQSLSPEQPPWEMHVIEGLAGGRVGLVAKVHHAAIDGVAGATLLAQLLDLSAEGRPVTETCPPWSPPALPSRVRLLTDAVPNLVTSPIRAVRALREVGRTAVRLARCAVSGEVGPLSIPLFASDTFDAPVVAERVVALGELGLSEINEIRQRFGVTINDVVLAICSGALRAHLLAHEGHSQSPLIAIVPVSVRPSDGEQCTGNRLSAMFVPLANDLEDARDRLETIAASSATTKAQEKAIGYGPVACALSDAVPPVLSQPVIQGGIQLGALRRLRAGNLLVSNVPGPDFPLYFAGMRLEAVHPLGPVVDGVALNITVQSYDGSLFVGINASATVMPDVPALAAAMAEELKALMEAAANMSEEERIAVLREQVLGHGALAAATMSGFVSRRGFVPHGGAPTANADRLHPVIVTEETSWD
jgi:WS/DGAT/MGAT family acyltransferase